MDIYDDSYPVPNEWVEEHLEDDQVAFNYIMSLDDLIYCEGIEGMNDFMDSVLSMRKAVLTDISYEIATPDPEDELGNAVLIRATGKLEAF